MIQSLTENAYKKWLSGLQLPQPKKDVLEKNLEKALEWWNKQPEGANDQIQRVLVSFGLHPTKLKNQNFEIMVKVMTVTLYVRGMTLAAYPHELFKSEATSLHFADLSLLYSVFGPVDSLYSFSFH